MTRAVPLFHEIREEETRPSEADRLGEELRKLVAKHLSHEPPKNVAIERRAYHGGVGKRENPMASRVEFRILFRGTSDSPYNWDHLEVQPDFREFCDKLAERSEGGTTAYSLHWGDRSHADFEAERERAEFFFNQGAEVEADATPLTDLDAASVKRDESREVPDPKRVGLSEQFHNIFLRAAGVDAGKRAAELERDDIARPEQKWERERDR